MMHFNNVPRLYYSASSSNKCSLYISSVSQVLGSVPLLPCFVAGNKQQTLLHGIGSRQGAIADTSPHAGNSSKLFEVSPWKWHHGRAAKKGICG